MGLKLLNITDALQSSINIGKYLLRKTVIRSSNYKSRFIVLHSDGEMSTYFPPPKCVILVNFVLCAQLWHGKFS